MPLNITQLNILRQTLKLSIDAILEMPDSHEQKTAWLNTIISNKHPTQAETVALLKAAPDEFFKDLLESLNMPISAAEAERRAKQTARRADWQQTFRCLQEISPILPPAILQRLKASPNYDPVLLASMLQFEKNLAGASEEIKILLIRLRELYLEMTPMSGYSYNPDLPPTFHFRLGEVPLNLDRSGNTPIKGEIREEVLAYVQERIELAESHQEALSRLNQVHIAHNQDAAFAARIQFEEMNAAANRAHSKHLEAENAWREERAARVHLTRQLQSSILNPEVSTASSLDLSTLTLADMPILAPYAGSHPASSLSSATMMFSASATLLQSVAFPIVSRKMNVSEEVKKNMEILENLKTLAALGDMNAQFNLGICYLKIKDIQHEWYRKFLRPELMEGEIPLPWFYEKGIGVVENPNEAFNWFKRAAIQGHVKAQHFVACCYLDGRGVIQNEHLAAEWCEKTAKQGFANAQYLFGWCYEHGKGVAKDEREAVVWYRKAAEQSYAKGQMSLGWCYCEGKGVAKNEREAVVWFHKAAEQGDGDAQYNLAQCYDTGKGVAKDEREAVAWYRKAAEQGNAGAQYGLGLSYAYGIGIVKDEREAVVWYRKAAEQGNADVQFLLGWGYAYGIGIVKDEREAVVWYRRAAEQGYIDAQCNLAQCYYDGKGVAKDEREAFIWCRKAAEQGHARAQYNLAQCYDNGKGVAKDEREAVIWYRKAAEQEHAGAIKALERLTPQPRLAIAQP